MLEIWQIERFISLTFRSMGTECAYDYVFVYDGASFAAPLLGSFSGRTAPPKVTATSGSMLLLLYSDTNYVLDGFRAEYAISACPGNCTGRGYCLKGRCVCNGAEWGGIDCSRRLCPNGKQCFIRLFKFKHLFLDCGRHERPVRGHCNKGRCLCRSGYSGRACSLPEGNPGGNQWHFLAQSGEGLRPRAAHSAVYVEITDSLYVFGGYDLNHVLADLEVYNFQSSSWRDSNGSELMDWESVDRVEPSEAADFIAQQGIDRLGLPKKSFFGNIFYAVGDNSSRFMRRQRHSGRGSMEETLLGPPARYGHAACAVANGFTIFGGKMEDGTLANDLWYYNVQTRLWHLRAQFSTARPPPLTRHTLTCVNDTIYLFGGSTSDGEFSSQLWGVNLRSDDTEQWEEVSPRGGKQLDIRVVAHTMVYHKATNSLIVYGGIVAGVARFSKLSDRMFAFQLDHKHWTEIHYTREHLREKFVPRERAFHSANVFGNYLVIFGGYSHRHNKEEICYDNQMYLYHLGCHTWVNSDILGSNNESRYPKQQGVFAHASSIRNSHTLILVGGYHGNVNGDLLAWTAPSALRDLSPKACALHQSFGACAADPECGWCSADDRCYGRTVGANCTTNLQTARCPGVCTALQDCHSCLVHGHLHASDEEATPSSAAYRLGLGKCAWCVQNARCHPRDDPHGTCGSQVDSPSQTLGWWGPQGQEIHQPQDCASLDRRPGLTYIKYNHPPNFSQPDSVATLNATTIDYNGGLSLSPRSEATGGKMVATLTGFLRLPPSWSEIIKICSSYSTATVTLGEVFTFEYLEPFANGSCSQYANCLHCLTDSQCGWCELTSSCQSRSENEQETCFLGNDWRYLTLLPGMCPNCSNYISCTSCVNTELCEWWVEEARCTRMGQRPGSVVTTEECPMPCYQRNGCDACLDQKGRCVWCQATQKCFSFSVYTSEYQFGLCREWLDQAFPLITAHENSSLTHKPQEQCKACAAHSNCSACLSALSCGWCHDASNPMSGTCVRGDFQQPHVECSVALGGREARWAYAQCPDVDECGLGLHDCHPQAECTNTDGSFSCHCRKGFIGDGRSSCVRTCYNVCVHGFCQGEPDYKCLCDIGWYGDDCSKNCGCNNHSACPEGYQICEKCEDNTMGEFCQYCRSGSYGNATKEIGCRKCECNGHGDFDKGECDIETGECFCHDNTEGFHCEKCQPNYSGDPRNGQQCYYQCEARGVLTEPKGQGISSLQNYLPPRGGPPTRECLWIIKPDVDFGTAIIQLQLNSSQLNVTCGENAVYVYDGLPELVEMGSQSALTAVFCTEDALPTAVVESRTGHLTVHYKQGRPNESFSALYKVLSCESCDPPRECRDGQCVCSEGFVGPSCEEQICPENCSFALGRGNCDKNYGRCLCTEGWTGPSCNVQSQRLAMDVWRIFLKSWTAKRHPNVTVESTPDARMPQGRYFHGADIVHSKQSIYVYGGLTKPRRNPINRTLNDFWQFDIQNQRWSQIQDITETTQSLTEQFGTNEWPPPLYGHTLTYYRNADREEFLVLIGGDSPQNRFWSTIWEYNIEKNVWKAVLTKVGIFGHTTVFHSQTNSLYVFGGYAYDKDTSIMSNSLYRFEYETKSWIELTSSNSGNPKPRFFHSAVTTDHYMLVLGGRIYPWNVTDALYAFSFSCNQWINLMAESVDKIGSYPKQTYAQAMTIEPDGTAAYVIGGWGIDSQATVLKIELPIDICHLFSTKSSCLRVPGCGYCSNQLANVTVAQICHRNTLECPLDTGNAVASEKPNQVALCLAPCTAHRTCVDCLFAPGCRWSTRLRECVSTASQPAYCAGGVCGLVLEENDSAHCPEPCHAFTQCSSCLRHGPCGWCAAPGENGEGICAEGNSERPMKGDCFKEGESDEDDELANANSTMHYSWHYVKCPKENECQNGHHSCADEAEICVDLDDGFECKCGEGYKPGTANCVPVCPQGCVRGRCVAPSICECDFGYVGANCSIQCLCNGHSNCEGPDKLDTCLECHNNTMVCRCITGIYNMNNSDFFQGDRCQYCKPLFVGDPANRSPCVPCLEYCHGHSAFCVDPADGIQPNDYVDQESLLESLKEGPKNLARCLRCSNHTTGERCERCISGNFRGSEELEDACRPCECHGHGTVCDAVTGDQCDCQNNTVSDECGQGRNSAQPCWQVQCSRCREGFLGTPTRGRQCYRQMSVDNKMCFDAKPIDECKNPKPLHPGDVVFFVIQPRFMNVDIRIVIDVTLGRLNVFMSTHDDTYIAYPNTTTGLNDVLLDTFYRPFDNGSRKSENVHINTEATGLRTYITITKPKTILTVKNLQARLVITLPEEYHKLETTRFFLILQSAAEHQPAYGVVFSRQDQLHIDLFVFFSVFFSVFFLFLAACVVAWKAKQAADARHARRRHVVEMLHMAKRPFACVTLDLNSKLQTGKKAAHHEVRPVAIEPTGDGVAAVATVFVSLPGGQNLPVKLALASSLILLVRQFPTSGDLYTQLLQPRHTYSPPCT
ncbi:hypothetical protein YQE_06202, partial [Dendroctonus ponderosae]